MAANEPDERPPTGPVRINPYTVPDDQHGWRGLGVPGHFKRKWYTVLHNEQVLVTALLLLPGETSIRHSHESGELSIRYTGELQPIVTWNAPGLLHGPPEPPPDLSEPFADVLAEETRRAERARGPTVGQPAERQPALGAARRPAAYPGQTRRRPWSRRTGSRPRPRRARSALATRPSRHRGDRYGVRRADLHRQRAWLL